MLSLCKNVNLHRELFKVVHIYIEKLGERKLNRIHFKAKLSNKTVYIAAFVHAMYAECAGADYTSPRSKILHEDEK